ncbi:MAG: Ig-like domain-containing protein, partial [Actinomycetota bacterium]
NRPPVAVADRFTTSPGHALSAGLLGNDSDPDGDALLTGTGTITTAAGGQVTFYGDGLFYYRTPAGFVGVDRFEYGVSDSYGARDVGEVTIGVGVPS